MAENKMKQIAELLGVEFNSYFKIKGADYNPYIIYENGLFDRQNRNVIEHIGYLLMGDYEVEKPILTEKEKRYLRGVLRPFRDRVECISKKELAITEQSIRVYFYDEESMSFPNFEKGTMYKGVEIDRKYTIKELGLFQDA